MDRIVAVFGKRNRRLYKMQWTSHPGEDSWEAGHTLLQDGCKEAIDEFWAKTNENPASDRVHSRPSLPAQTLDMRLESEYRQLTRICKDDAYEPT